MTGRRSDHDVIVVGARAAGAATAMLLARHGWRVLALERAAYGADTVSTHALMRAGVVQLHRWGLLDAVVAAGTPPVRQTIFHYDDESVTVPFTPGAGIDALFAPRRTVLDPILADGAIAAGADLRFGAAVDSVVREPDGRVVGVAGRWPGGGRFRARRRADRRRCRRRPVAGGPIGGRPRDRPDAPRRQRRVRVLRGRGRRLRGLRVELPARSDRRGDADQRRRVGVGRDATGPLRPRGPPRCRSGFCARLAGAALPSSAPGSVARARPSRFHVHRGRTGFLRQLRRPGLGAGRRRVALHGPAQRPGLTDAFRDAELLARAVDDGLRHPASMAEGLARYQRRPTPLASAAHRGRCRGVVPGGRWTRSARTSWPSAGPSATR